MRYIPTVHTGTKEDIIRGLLEEAGSVSRDGMLRLHAKSRELRRIVAQLESVGATFLVGTGPDEGFFLVVTKHRAECQLDQTDVCKCPHFHRVEGIEP